MSTPDPPGRKLVLEKGDSFTLITKHQVVVCKILAIRSRLNTKPADTIASITIEAEELLTRAAPK